MWDTTAERESREAAIVMEENGPPESAYRGRLQTTDERHWLKTVVVSVIGKGLRVSKSCVN